MSVKIREAKLNIRQISDDIFKCIFLNVNENVRIPIHISLKFVSKGDIKRLKWVMLFGTVRQMDGGWEGGKF